MATAREEKCPDCRLLKWFAEAPEADDDNALWCECPILKVAPYRYGEDDAPDGAIEVADEDGLTYWVDPEDCQEG